MMGVTCLLMSGKKIQGYSNARSSMTLLIPVPESHRLWRIEARKVFGEASYLARWLDG